MIAVGGDEHLGLVAQSAEGDRVDDPVAVALEDVTGAARPFVGFGMKAPARGSRQRRRDQLVPSGTIRSLSELLHLNAFTSTNSRSAANVSASEAVRNGPITNFALLPA